MKSAKIALVAFLTVGFSGACVADDMVAAAQVAGGKLAFLLKPALANATLSVAGPNGFHASTFSKAGALAIDLSQFGPLEDGTYNYQLTASGGTMVTVRTPLNNGRDKEPKTQPVGVSMSGTFQVKGGQIIKPDTTKTERQDR
jgi:hypothetical protein